MGNTSDRKHKQSLYKTRRWHKMRARQLRDNPLCSLHLELGRSEPATIVDHKIPHHGDETLFFDEANLQSMCKPCHDKHKQRQEKSGYMAGGDVAGVPLDRGHHWNAIEYHQNHDKDGKKSQKDGEK